MHNYQTNYIKQPSKNTNYTKITSINSNWEVFDNRHTYGAEYGKTTRVKYGDHVLFGVSHIDFKVKNTNYST